MKVAIKIQQRTKEKMGCGKSELRGGKQAINLKERRFDEKVNEIK